MEEKEYVIKKLDKMINAIKSLKKDLVKATGTDNPFVALIHGLQHDLIDIQCSVTKINVRENGITK